MSVRAIHWLASETRKISTYCAKTFCYFFYSFESLIPGQEGEIDETHVLCSARDSFVFRSHFNRQARMPTVNLKIP